ncbi:MAG: SurA N-terminal domain-containing protein [Desulfatibacillum sp.]|nr:SurA N-terminal domain-containing protein [Desulfatibacillum sp.]
MKNVLTTFMAAACLLVIACSSEDMQEAGPVVVRVNDYCLYQNEFQDLLAQEMRLEEDYKLTREAQMQFLEDMVTRQVLIQEAKRLKLDSREKFVKSVQRFWESALIRDLLEMKAREIGETTQVTQEEVLNLYRQLKEEDPDIPAFDTLQKELSDRAMEEKKTRLLAQWIRELENRCEVKIDEDLLLGQQDEQPGQMRP